MKQLLQLFFNHQSNLYKGFLYIISCFVIINILPIDRQFAYEFSKGSNWEYDTLYAPFDFPIIKTAEEIEAEKIELKKAGITYFEVDVSIEQKVQERYEKNFQTFIDLTPTSRGYSETYAYGKELLKAIFETGIVPINYQHNGGQKASLIRDRSERDVPYSSLIRLDSLSDYLSTAMGANYQDQQANFYNLFFEILEPNLMYSEKYNRQALEELFTTLSPTRDLVVKGDVIISPDERIEGVKWDKLRSLRQYYTTDSQKRLNTVGIIFGYSLMVGLVLMLIFLFIYRYRLAVFEDNNKLTFLFFNLLLMVGLSSFLVQFNSSYLYALPICIFPLITKAFFDARLGLFIHVLSVLLVGFIVPNSFEYTVIQLLAGIVTILSVSELYKRANLFISVAQITLVYLLGYLAFFALRVGELSSLDASVFGLFLINGLLTLFVQPLIYFYERIFNLVSDVSLLELSDTNSNLLKQLSDTAPGTFHHSLQVANLAEAAAVAVNANILLTRVGALYHDVGKIKNPTFFSENQRGRVSPHDELSPKESSKYIIQHVLDGIELAKKNNLPDRVIDFIRTHHGTSRVHYFFRKQEEMGGAVEEEFFQYKGPKPFSKETAIVMMVDAVEAASKSLKEPTVDQLEYFVHKIIDQQQADKQLFNANITLAEIETVKKIVVKKLVNVYQLRVAYPE